MHKVNIRMLVWVPSTSLGLWEQAPHLCLGDAQHRTHPLGLLLLLLPVKSLYQAETMLVNWLTEPRSLEAGNKSCSLHLGMEKLIMWKMCLKDAGGHKYNKCPYRLKLDTGGNTDRLGKPGIWVKLEKRTYLIEICRQTLDLRPRYSGSEDRVWVRIQSPELKIRRSDGIILHPLG